MTNQSDTVSYWSVKVMNLTAINIHNKNMKVHAKFVVYIESEHQKFSFLKRNSSLYICTLCFIILRPELDLIAISTRDLSKKQKKEKNC